MAIGLLTWVPLAALSVSFHHSGNVWSRYMTIESIVERGTLEVGRSPLLRASGSPDLARFRGRFYSDKPPVLPALGALVYAPMNLAGVRMASSPSSLRLVNWVLVTLLVASGSALAAVATRALLQLLEVSKWGADLLALGVGYGTLLFTYGVTFNNHATAAGLITAAAALVTLDRPGKGAFAWRSLAGFLAGLAATIDLPAGTATLAGLLVWELARGRRVFLAFALGTIAPLALHIILQSSVTGTPLPVEFYPESLEYPGSYWATEAGRFRESGPRAWFLAEFLAGPQGWLTVTPVLAFGLVSAARAGARSSRPPAPLAWVTLGTVVVLVIYYVFLVRRTDFAGQSFGTRHMLPITPLVYFWACLPPRGNWCRRYSLVFTVLWLVGAVYAWEGRKDPWSRIESRSEPVLALLQRVVVYPYSSYQR